MKKAKSGYEGDSEVAATADQNDYEESDEEDDSEELLRKAANASKE